MNQEERILEHIDNLEQDFRMLDNIFKCMNMYWKGDGADAVINTYKDLGKDIEEVREHLAKLKGMINE